MRSYRHLTDAGWSKSPLPLRVLLPVEWSTMPLCWIATYPKVYSKHKLDFKFCYFFFKEKYKIGFGKKGNRSWRSCQRDMNMIKIHFANFSSTNKNVGCQKMDWLHGYVLYVVTLGLLFSLTWEACESNRSCLWNHCTLTVPWLHLAVCWHSFAWKEGDLDGKGG